MTRIEDTLTRALNTLRTTRLPDEARSRIKLELLSYASLHEFAPGTTPTRTAIRSPFSIFRFRLYASFAVVVLIVASLGGTAFASEHALPGDALYSIKVAIAEPLQTALIPSDQGRAAWHAILAERRLDETAQLAAHGTLSTTTQATLAANFDAQVTASEKSADRLENTGDISGSLSARSDLEARLNAHTQILSVMAAHFALATSSEDESTHTALEHMIAFVVDHQRDVVSGRLALENAIAPNKGTDSATMAAKVAIANPVPARLRLKAGPTPEAQVVNAATVRTEEQQHILDRHATFLAKFLPIATTTATSTATTTATTTVSATTTPSKDSNEGNLER